MAYKAMTLNQNATYSDVRTAMYRENLIRAQAMSLPYDTQRIYYQNLKFEDVIRVRNFLNFLLIDCINISVLIKNFVQVGHSSDIITKCLFSYGENLAVAGKACQDSLIEVKRFSNPNYFNCFTITFKEYLLIKGTVRAL